MSGLFAIVTRDDLWSLDRRALVESRLLHGLASEEAGVIDARDDCDRELLVLCDRERDRVTSVLTSLTEGRARTVVSARRESGSVTVSATISLTNLDVSLVTTVDHLVADHSSLIDFSLTRPDTSVAPDGLPLVWSNGSGAVLLHEAAGHPSEHSHGRLDWPSWLSVHDESDAGRADLLAGEAPHALRRESFTDVPLNRMTNVVVSAQGSREDRGPRTGDRGPGTEDRGPGTEDRGPMPERFVEILLVAGGRYEPLDGMVSLSISVANLIDGELTVRLRPFMIQRSRADVARSIRSGGGTIRRYPGVICSKEGQELFVGSAAPDLLTQFG